MIKLAIILPIALTALLYGDGYIGQFIYNYQVWDEADGELCTTPTFPIGNIYSCLTSYFLFPYTF